MPRLICNLDASSVHSTYDGLEHTRSKIRVVDGIADVGRSVVERRIQTKAGQLRQNFRHYVRGRTGVH